MLDIASRLIPFNNHDDVTRIQMSNSQSRQTIPIINAEIPYIRTGFEEQYLPYSSYLYIAKDNGKIIYKDNDILIAKYDNNNKGEIIRLDSLYGNREGFDKILISKFNENDLFNKGDILARHSTISEDGFLTLGCNLKTTYISSPYNFKDAIVISESCAKKMTTRIIAEETIDCVETIPILWNNNSISYPQGTFVNKAEPIFLVKERIPRNPIHLVSEGEKILAPKSGKLYYKLIIDEIAKLKDQEDYYNNIYKQEIEKETLIAEKIKELYNLSNERELLEANAYINYYCPQLNQRRSGKSILLKYWIVQEVPLQKGSKISNRHGNKGVIAKIYPDEEMAQEMLNGEYSDIIVNPMCMTSRMNVGQLFELHSNRANNLYTSKIINNNNLSIDNKIEKLYEMCCDIQPDYINQIFRNSINNFSEEDKIKYINNVAKYNMTQIVHPPFTKFTYEDCLHFCQKYGNMDVSLKEHILYNNEVIDASFGYVYWYRLEHEPDKKYFSRSIGNYNRLGQPTKGLENNKSAHRIGELETWALLSHQAYENLLEFFVTKSDSISEAARMLKYLYDDCAEKYTPFIQTPGILKVFKTYCNAAGYEMIDIENDNIQVINNFSNKNNDQVISKSVPTSYGLDNIYDLFDTAKELDVLMQDNDDTCE